MILNGDATANLILFREAKKGIEKKLNELKPSGDYDWKHADNLVTHENKQVRTFYKAWKQSQDGIDQMLEQIHADELKKTE